jgi:hypothetical protein
MSPLRPYREFFGMETVLHRHVTWRIIAGFLIAPFVAATAMACVEPDYFGIGSAFERIFHTTILFSALWAYPTTIMFGLPGFFFLRRRVAASPLNCVLAGAGVAAAPWVALSLFHGSGDTSLGGHDLIVDGYRTVWGWIEFCKLMLKTTAFGAFGGLIFWLVASAGAQKPNAHVREHAD